MRFLSRKSFRRSLDQSHFYDHRSFQVLVGLSIGFVVMLFTQEWLIDIGGLRDVELLTVDYRFEGRGADPDLQDSTNVIIVEISDEDQEALPGAFPFPRSYYAHVIENLQRAGARVIAIDMTFERDTDDDEALRDLLQRSDNVVLGVKTQASGARGLYEIERLEQDYRNIFFDVNPRVGVVNVVQDRDEVVRRYVPMMDVAGKLLPTFSFAVAGRAMGLPPLTTVDILPRAFRFGEQTIPRYDPRSFMLDYYGPVRSFRYVSFSHVIDDERFLTDDEAMFGEALNLFDEGLQALFKDKIVLIGSTMAEERDYHNVPFANPGDPDRSHTMHGVEIHATAVQNLLDGRFIRRPARWMEGLALPLLSLFTFMLLLWFKTRQSHTTVSLVVGTGALVMGLGYGIYWGAIFAFEEANLLLGIVAPAATVLFSYLGAVTYTYLTERQKKAIIEDAFSRYVSPTLVFDLLNSPEKIRLGGERREMTVMFTDIAGFTSLAEHLNPEELVEFLNEYLDNMIQIIFQQAGTVDKFIGDAIMAFWGAPVPQFDHPLRACLTALEMQERLKSLRQQWRAEGKPPLHVRCGINTGPMIVGNMGGEGRYDYTVIGDSVNLASRMEGANKEYGTFVMISEATYRQVENDVRVRELDLLQVKGKTKPVRVYELMGTNELQLSAEEEHSLKLYAEGLSHFKQRAWADAIDLMHQAYTLDPTCQPAYLYIQRAQEFLKNPPPDSWDGVYRLSRK